MVERIGFGGVEGECGGFLRRSVLVVVEGPVVVVPPAALVVARPALVVS